MYNIYWLTGLPCSGKSTIANGIKSHIRQCEILNGDEIRNKISNVGFSRDARSRHMLYVAYMANRLSSYADVIVDLVSPLRDVRDKIKSNYKNVFEIYVKCDIDICEVRDVKGHYKKASEGEILDFTGVQSEYEIPLVPDLEIDTSILSIDDCVNQIITSINIKN
jgi:adenylylsulfate kinase